VSLDELLELLDESLDESLDEEDVAAVEGESDFLAPVPDRESVL